MNGLWLKTAQPIATVFGGLREREAPMAAQLTSQSFTASDIAAWHHEKFGGRLLLYLDCDRSVALQIVAKLRQHGLFVEVWGPARVPARNGRLYQHFLQISRPSADGNLPALGEVLDAVEELRPLQPQPDELAKLRAQIEEEKRVNAGLASQLHKAKIDIRDLEAQRDNARRLERQHNELAQEVDRLANESQSLRSQLSQALARATTQEAVRGRLQQLEEENTSLRKWITDQAQQLRAADELVAEAETDTNRLRAEKVELEEEVARLRERAEKLAESEAPESVEVMQALLPKVVIFPESLGYIFRGIQDRRPILELLVRLNQDCESIRHKTTKPVETADGWMERHFSTGQGDEGRLYYSKPDQVGKRYVLIAPKNEQKHSVRKLQNFTVQ